MIDRRLIRASVAASLPQLLEARGVSPGPLLRRAGFSEDLSSWSRTLVAQSQLVTLVAMGERAAGDAHLACHIGENLLYDAGPVSLVLLHAPTLAAAIEAVQRPLATIHPAASFRIEAHRGRVAIVERVQGVPATERRQLYEAGAQAVCSMMRLRLDPAWAPREVRFPHAAPSDRGRRLAELLRSPIHFDGDALRIVVDQRDLSRAFRPVPSGRSAPPVPEVDFVRDDAALIGQLGLMIEGMLALGDLSSSRAAQTLGLSRRTLQLRLARLGESFSGLVERRRQSAAERLLLEGRLPIIDIAMLLGYSDAANFTRAFRRWTGISPRAFRSERRAGGAGWPWS